MIVYAVAWNGQNVVVFFHCPFLVFHHHHFVFFIICASPSSLILIFHLPLSINSDLICPANLLILPIASHRLNLFNRKNMNNAIRLLSALMLQHNGLFWNPLLVFITMLVNVAKYFPSLSSLCHHYIIISHHQLSVITQSLKVNGNCYVWNVFLCQPNRQERPKNCDWGY